MHAVRNTGLAPRVASGGSVDDAEESLVLAEQSNGSFPSPVRSAVMSALPGLRVKDTPLCAEASADVCNATRAEVGDISSGGLGISKSALGSDQFSDGTSEVLKEMREDASQQSPSQDAPANNMPYIKRVRSENRPKDTSANVFYHEIPRFDALKMSPEELRAKVLSVPICFVQNMVSEMDKTVFTMDFLSKHYGDRKVDVLLQNPDSFGFPVPPNTPVWNQTLKMYVDYAKELEKSLGDDTKRLLDEKVLRLMSGGSSEDNSICPIIGREFDEEPGKKNVKFCVNVDCGSWSTVVNELSKLPKWCKWGQSDELLSCLPGSLTIPGLSLPQLYLKVPGVWTGGHEENLRFFSINSNHGPGNSIWGAIAPEHAKRFKDAAMAQKGCNIYSTEGRWFPDFDFCAKNGIPVYLGVQRPGDTAILNGGTLHWVRSGSFAVNSSWNFGIRDGAQLDLAFERDLINYKLGVRSIVPIRSLGLGVMRDFMRRYEGRSKGSIGKNEARFMEHLIRHMQSVAKTETRYLQLISRENTLRKRSIPIVEEPLGSLVILCDDCWREIVHHYIVCDTCADRNIRNGVETDPNKANPVFFCVPCGIQHVSGKQKHKVEARYKMIDGDETDMTTFVEAFARFYEVTKKSLLK